MIDKRLIGILCFAFTAPVMAERITGELFATRSEVIAQNGMAATSQPLATQVALDILKAGGSAVDAAIAANAMLGLVEPTGNGIGGDLFALVWDPETARVHGLDASGRAPAGLTLEMLRARGLDAMPAYGVLPVTVPGCVDGWAMLHKRFGRLSWAELFRPAIGYARDGFPVSELIAHYLALSADIHGTRPGFAETWMPSGAVPGTGDVFRNPRLAKTLERIASGGRDAFYSGEIAEAIDAHMRAHGGFLRATDLAAHRSNWVEPLSTTYRGYRVWELGPNTQGIAALQMLNILEAYDLSAMGLKSPEYLHLLVEAKKLAFADRAEYFADPAFADIPVERLIDKAYAAERRALIDPERAAQRVDAGALEAGDTIYLATADADGMMVSLIQSNYRGMGSGVVPGDLGFMLQNRGELFSLDPAHRNVYAPGKRPFHTIIPGFVSRDGTPDMAFGVMGGAMQPQGHVQVLINRIDFGMNIQEAGDAPRVRHFGSAQPTGGEMTQGGTVALESGFGSAVAKALMEKGHRVLFDRGGFGGYQAIRFDADQGVYYGASESRKDGQAAGY